MMVSSNSKILMVIVIICIALASSVNATHLSRNVDRELGSGSGSGDDVHGESAFSERGHKSSKSSGSSGYSDNNGASKSSKSPHRGDSSKSPKGGTTSQVNKSNKSSKGSGSDDKAPSPERTHAPTMPHTPPAPTNAPTKSQAVSGSQTGAPRPPTNMATEMPASSPSTTDSPMSAPSNGGSPDTDQPTQPEGVRTVTLDRYAVSYTLPSGLPDPTRDNFEDLTSATESFLETFMGEAFEATSMATFLAFMSEFVTSSTTNGVTVIYDSSANFTESSDDGLTNPNSLKTTLESAFEGQSATDYINFLRANLPSTNPFSRTISVANAAIVTPSSEDRSGSSRSSSATRGAIIAGASGLLILTAGVILYRRGMSEEADGIEYVGKKFDKSHPMQGDMTVAGETFTGETCVSSPSYMRDEENGDMVNIDLGPPADGYDSSSIAPVWDDVDSVACDAGSNIDTIPEEFEDEFCDNEETQPIVQKQSFSTASTAESKVRDFATCKTPPNTERPYLDTSMVSPGAPSHTSISRAPVPDLDELMEQLDDDEEQYEAEGPSGSSELSVHDFEEFLASESRASTEAGSATVGSSPVPVPAFRDTQDDEIASYEDETPARRPLTVAEIESLLSEEEWDDDIGSMNDSDVNASAS